MDKNILISKLSGIIKDDQIIREIACKLKSSSLNNINESVNRLFGTDQSRQIITNYEDFLNQKSNSENNSEDLLIEAIVHFYGRPALLIQNGTFETPLSAVLANKLNNNAELINKAIKSVGRIEIKNHPDHNWIGTGWLVRENIVVTNRHVADVFSYISPTNKIIFRRNLDSMAVLNTSIDFYKEYNSAYSEEFEIKKVLYLAEDEQPDIALLQISRFNFNRSELPEPIELDLDIQSKLNQDIVVIGYPAYDTRNTNILEMNRIFGSIYDVKRLQPGKLVKIIDDDCVWHDCSTLGGNSGSPVIDINTGKAIAIHYAGHYLKMNEAVPAKRIDEIIKNIK